MFIFMICATRTNVVYTLIFLSLLLVFLLLSSAYWQLGQGNAAIGDRCVKVNIIPSKAAFLILQMFGLNAKSTFLIFRGLERHCLSLVCSVSTC
jgi:hypothetical protein